MDYSYDSKSEQNEKVDRNGESTIPMTSMNQSVPTHNNVGAGLQNPIQQQHGQTTLTSSRSHHDDQGPSRKNSQELDGHDRKNRRRHNLSNSYSADSSQDVEALLTTSLGLNSSTLATAVSEPRDTITRSDSPSFSTSLYPHQISHLDPQRYVTSSSSSGQAHHGSSPIPILHRVKSPHFKASKRSAIASLDLPSRPSSPALSQIGDLTPLPSPVSRTGSPGPWRKLSEAPPRTKSKDSLFDLVMNEDEVDFVKRETRSTTEKRYPSLGLNSTGPVELASQLGLLPSAAESQSPDAAKSRSFSDYNAEALAALKQQRQISVAITKQETKAEAQEKNTQLHREPRLALQRGLTSQSDIPPTPPPSNQGTEASDSDSLSQGAARTGSLPLSKPVSDEVVAPEIALAATLSEGAEIYQAVSCTTGEKLRWRAIRQIGEGTFSKVMLASSHLDLSVLSDISTADLSFSPKTTTSELVAVKVVEQGPAGGASEERVEESLKRELDLMKKLSHASLVSLYAFGIEPRRALLVMQYCAGGDLFEFATQHKDVLGPDLVQRIFAELVAATAYMHSQNVCHRDIKLESEPFTKLEILL
jgi:protein-serine/threonine kinase